MLERVQSGDEILVTKLDRLARSITDLRELVDGCLSRGVSVIFLKDNMSFKAHEKNNAMKTLMLNVVKSAKKKVHSTNLKL